jgi:hypothetical protein
VTQSVNKTLDSQMFTQTEEEEGEKKVKKKSFFENIIIKENSKWKAAFDIYINLMVAYSCFTTIYFVCFNAEVTLEIEILNYIVEASFLIDIIMNFLTEYKDPETYETVRSLGKIARKYVFRGWFIIDFIGIVPF